MTDTAATLARRGLLAAGLALAASYAAAGDRDGLATPVVELRQYTTRRGRRDELIRLFEAEFIESQAAVGAQVLGLFRDRDDPDRFVWLRGFPSMAARAQALSAFYFGPVWKAHRAAANATILDSDNVLLLRPAQPFGSPERSGGSHGDVVAFIHYLDEALLAPFAADFPRRIASQAAAAGAELLASYVSETAANTFPQLPVRERDRVFVWLARVPAGREARFLARWQARAGWRDDAGEALLPAFMRKPEMLRLTPTARSPLS